MTEKDIHTTCEEIYISVDVETAGPNPWDYSMLSLGACLVFKPDCSFYLELKPINENALPEAMQVSGLSLEKLKKDGLPPGEAMLRFSSWLTEVTPDDHRPVFVGFNAPFDWMFVNDYFHRYLGRNPFGHNALDVKAFYMGLKGTCWRETTMSRITKHYFGERRLSHHALQDAVDQANIFRMMLTESRSRK